MLLDPQGEVTKATMNLADCLAGTEPSKQFRADMILTLVGMYLKATEIKKTDNITERRAILHEFVERRNALRKGIEMLEQSNTKPAAHEERLRRAMP